MTKFLAIAFIIWFAITIDIATLQTWVWAVYAILAVLVLFVAWALDYAFEGLWLTFLDKLR